MARLRILVGVLLATTVGLAAGAGAETGTYVTGTGDLYVDCTIDDTGFSDTCIGGHTFEVPGTPERVDIEIDDEFVEPVGGLYEFTNGADTLAIGSFCGTTVRDVPAQATELSVHVDAAFGAEDCYPQPGVGTIGNIHVTWT